MRVSDLTRQKPVRVLIDLGDGDSIALVFDRNRVTPAWVTVAQQRDEEQDTLSLPKALADVVVSWDVYAEVEGDYPPSPENIARLSYPTQSELLRRIMEAAVPSRAEGNDSSVPPVTPSSGSEAPAPSSPNGLVTVPSPVVSESASST